jgi:hypothetical protein
MGLDFLQSAFDDWCSGVKEKHPTRAEVKMINEDGTFQKMILEDTVPFYRWFSQCTFEAQEGYFEMAWQIQRAKIRALRKSGGTLFGPKHVATTHEMERRRTVAEHARSLYELLKSTQLVMDAINWRVTGKRLTEAESELSGIALDDARPSFKRQKMQKTLR